MIALVGSVGYVVALIVLSFKALVAKHVAESCCYFIGVGLVFFSFITFLLTVLAYGVFT